MLAGPVFLGTLVGSNTLAFCLQTPLILLLAIGGTLMCIHAYRLAGSEFRAFLLFALALFAASLRSPMTVPSGGFTAWQTLASNPGVRYWFFPTLATAWCLAQLAFNKPRGSQPSRIIALLLLTLMSFGVIRDWRCPAEEDLHFAQYADKLQTLTPGTALVIPENPTGWNLTLIKR